MPQPLRTNVAAGRGEAVTLLEEVRPYGCASGLDRNAERAETRLAERRHDQRPRRRPPDHPAAAQHGSADGSAQRPREMLTPLGPVRADAEQRTTAAWKRVDVDAERREPRRRGRAEREVRLDRTGCQGRIGDRNAELPGKVVVARPRSAQFFAARPRTQAVDRPLARQLGSPPASRTSRSRPSRRVSTTPPASSRPTCSVAVEEATPAARASDCSVWSRPSSSSSTMAARERWANSPATTTTSGPLMPQP
jgi:hypothetical protein